MSVLAVLLVAAGVTDLVRAEGPASARRRIVATGAGLVVLVVVGLLGALTRTADLLLLLLAALVLAAWVVLSGRAVTALDPVTDQTSPALALGVPAAGLGVLLACSGAASPVGGPLHDWLAGLDLPAVERTQATHVLLVCGLLLAQFATANVVVRLVLAGVGAIKPRGQPQPSDQLRGGRLLGPMERVVILGLGLAGQVTAAGIVIAAKGLIRWPELQARARAGDRPGIDEVTEYFLIGSFVSWLVALVSLWLAQT